MARTPDTGRQVPLATSTGVRVGLLAPATCSYAELRRFLMWARMAGVDSFLVNDHWQDFVPRALWEPSLTCRARQSPGPHAYRETLTVLGMLARHAGRVRIGTAVIDTVRRHPVMVAQAALTLSESTRRPLILGIGSGERMNTEPYGVDTPVPVARFEEAVQVIRLCLQSSGSVHFAGRHFHLDGAVMDLSPPPHRTPSVWVAAHRPRMLEIAGRYGDGWIPIAGQLDGPAGYELAWRTIRTAALAADRDAESITPSLVLMPIIAPTAAQAEAMLQSRLVRYWTLIGRSAEWWRALGFTHPLGSDFGGVTEFIPEDTDAHDLEAAIARVPSELVQLSFVSGTPRQVVTSIRDYADAGLRHVVLAPLSAMIKNRYQNYFLWALPRIIRAVRR